MMMNARRSRAAAEGEPLDTSFESTYQLLQALSDIIIAFPIQKQLAMQRAREATIERNQLIRTNSLDQLQEQLEQRERELRTIMSAADSAITAKHLKIAQEEIDELDELLATRPYRR